MSEAQIKRRQNERKFGYWEPLPGGGRRYWYEVAGRGGSPTDEVNSCADQAGRGPKADRLP